MKLDALFHSFVYHTWWCHLREMIFGTKSTLSHGLKLDALLLYLLSSNTCNVTIIAKFLFPVCFIWTNIVKTCFYYLLIYDYICPCCFCFYLDKDMIAQPSFASIYIYVHVKRLILQNCTVIICYFILSNYSIWFYGDLRMKILPFFGTKNKHKLIILLNKNDLI
jgi:hypothetical protein